MSSKFLPLPANTVERLKELPQRVAPLEGLLALWLFGSLARDAWTPISDVDLAYLSCEGWQGEALDRFEARLYSAITSTLHTDDISLVHLRFAPIYLAWRVLTEGRLLLCSDKKAVATVAETGLPGYEISAWFGLFVPAATPKEIVERLGAASVRAVRSPDLQERLLENGFAPICTGPERL